jgi:hypothetical protein
MEEKSDRHGCIAGIYFRYGTKGNAEMNINARIDRLSTSKAKAALKWTVKRIAENDQKYIAESINTDTIQKIVLDDALFKSR